MAEDVRVGPSELMDSGSQGDSSVAEIIEEGVDALPEMVDREAEMPWEHPLTIEVPSKKEIVTVVPPSTLVETRPQPLPRLEEEGAVEAPQADDVARASDPAGLSGTVVQSPVLTSGRPTTSPLFGLYLHRGDEEAAVVRK